MHVSATRFGKAVFAPSPTRLRRPPDSPAGPRPRPRSGRPLTGKHSASHRAPGPSRSRSVPGWGVVVAIVLALVPAAWFAAQSVFGGDDPAAPPSDGSSRSEAPIPAVSPSAGATATP